MSVLNQIQTLQFQLEIPSAGHNRHIQDKIVNMFNYRLQSMLDTVLTSFSVTDSDIGFERIELTLDPIPLDMLEEELLEKTESALRNYFEAAFERLYTRTDAPAYPPANPGNTKQLYSVTQTATLAYFLLHGFYPWWEKETKPTLSQRWMDALQEEKKPFTGQLFLLGKKNRVVKRMAYQLSEDALKRTISAVEPTGANSILTFHKHLKTQHKKKPVSAGISGRDLTKAVWEFTLTYLFTEMGGVFNRKMFVKSQIKQIAQRYNTSYKAVLRFLNDGLSRLPENDLKSKSLFLNLKELEEELISEKKPVQADILHDTLVISLRKLLEKSSHTKKDKAALAYYITKLRKSEQSRKQLSSTLTAEAFEKLVTFIFPQEKNFIHAYLFHVEQAHRTHSLPGSSGKAFMNSIRELVLTYLLTSSITAFNRNRFVKSQILHMAKQHRVRPAEVLQFLVIGVEGTKGADREHTALSGILKLLLKENSLEETAPAPVPEVRPESVPALLHTLLSLPTLSAKEHQLLLAILRQYWKSKATSPVTALPDTELVKILQHLIPQHRVFLLQYATSLAPLHAKVFSASSLSAFRHRVWYYIIEALIAGSKAAFFPKTFLEEQLKKLASHFTVEYIAVLFHFMEEMSSVTGEHGISELKDTLATLYLEHHISPAVFGKIAEKTDFSPFIPQIVHFLRSGSYPPHSPYINSSALAQVFLELLLHYKDPLLSALQKQDMVTQQTKSLPGLAFFPEQVTSAWEQFQKDHFKDQPSVTDEVAPALTHTRYKNILAFYLETGSLPWWAAPVTLKEVLSYLPARPDLWQSFIQARQWTQQNARRLYGLFKGKQRETLLESIAEGKHTAIEKVINKALQHSAGNVVYTSFREEFLLFALQHSKTSLSPEAFALRYLKRFSEVHQLSYPALLTKVSAYLNSHHHSRISAFFEKEASKSITENTGDPDEKISSLLQAKEPDTTRLKKLSALLKKRDKSTVIEALGMLTGAGEKMPGIAVLKIFLDRLHDKDPDVISFFSDIARLATLPEIRHVSPGLYNDLLKFYTEYIRLKKITAFHPDEFLLRWFAYLERKNKAAAEKLARLFKKHTRKSQRWTDILMMYVSGTLPPPEPVRMEKEFPVEQLPTIDNTEVRQDRPTDTLTDKVLVFNSGLVLLWPFLHHCFTTLQYLRGSEFTSPETQERAIYLLHYVATEQYEEIGEELLVINKLLCGFPLLQPLSGSTAPTKQEKDLVESMLKAVITRWSKLGNTSIEGLRGSYIIREGYLEEEENGYQLQIEKKGYDILLDYLPWKLDLIKLPWMPKPLYVSWR